MRDGGRGGEGAVNVLVTGGTGFIGGCLCAKLVREGHTVRTLVRDPARAGGLREQGVEIAVGELRDRATLDAATAGVDTVFHFAAVFRKEVPRQEIWDTNVGGLENLLEASARAGVKRFVHCSSTSVYGLFPKTPTTEASPFVPIRGDLYQETKLAAEERVRRFASEGRLGRRSSAPPGSTDPATCASSSSSRRSRGDGSRCPGGARSCSR